MNGELQRVKKLAKRRGYDIFAGNDKDSDYWLAANCYCLPYIRTLDHIRAFLTSDRDRVAKVRRLCESFDAIEAEIDNLDDHFVIPTVVGDSSKPYSSLALVDFACSPGRGLS